MQKIIANIRSFFWWCAAVDVDVITSPQCPGIDRIKYTCVGALVCMTTIIATLGWTHNAALIFHGEALEQPIALALGALMGSLVFCMERMLIVSIPPNVSTRGKIAAFLWRGLLAAFSATIMTTPVALSYFKNEIVAQLDSEKLELMADKRQAVDNVFGLSAAGKAIGQLDAALDANRRQRDSLPGDVQDLQKALTACDVESHKLHLSLDPRIADGLARRDYLNRQVAGLQGDVGELRTRAAALTKQIGTWETTLRARAATCSALSGELQAAKDKYYAVLDDDRRRLLAEQAQKMKDLNDAKQTAKPVVATSDGVVLLQTTPDLGAQVRALADLASKVWLVRVLLAMFFAFFYLVDVMPIIAKLTSRSIYERFLGAREKKLVAQINADVAHCEAQAAIKAETAAAERDGFRAFKDGTGGSVFVEQAAIRARLEAAKTEALAPFQFIETLATALENAHNRITMLEVQFQGRADIQTDIERVRQGLREAMRQAASGLDVAGRTAANANGDVPKTTESHRDAA